MPNTEIPDGGYPVDPQQDIFAPPPARLEEDVYAGTTPRVRGSETSEKAGDSMIGPAKSLRTLVYEYLREFGPKTDEEIETALALKHQTASARRRELVLGGWVVETDERRETSSGRTATVWRALPRDERLPEDERPSTEIRGTIESFDLADALREAFFAGVAWDASEGAGSPDAAFDRWIEDR